MSSDRDKIKNLEDALKIVDESDLPSAPSSDRSFPVVVPQRSSSAAPRPASTDKYGIPVTQQRQRRVISRKASPVREAEPVGTAGVKPARKTYDFAPGDEAKNAHDGDQDIDIGSPDFKIKFDFESAYRDVPENKPLRLRREKRTGLVGGLMLAIFIICVSLVMASLAWMATVDILGFASEDELVSVQVPPDFTLESITDMLYESGLIRHKALFTLYADYSNAIDKISAGSFVLNKNYDYRALVQGMTARAGVRVETTVTIPEGFTLAQIFELLEAEGVCPADELWYTATHHDFNFHFLDRSTLGNRLRLEGFLFPETYNFFMDSTAQQAIIRMLREFNRRFTEEYIEIVAELDFTLHEIITIASLVEREAGNDDERPRIAAVIYNRLNSPSYPLLQIDATIDYARIGTGLPFSTQFDSPFNTYIHPGLPPGPIANPGMPSIRAALFPDTTNEFFYALNRYGTHNFFTNFTDHTNFVNSDAYGG